MSPMSTLGGETPAYARFRAKTSTLKVAKMLLLKKRNYGLHSIWASCIDGREARGINNMLGGELKELLDATKEGLCITKQGANRFKGYHTQGAPMKLRVCKYFKDGYCRSGES